MAGDVETEPAHDTAMRVTLASSQNHVSCGTMPLTLTPMTPARDPKQFFQPTWGIMEDDLGRRNQGGGIMEKEPWRRNHGEGSSGGGTRDRREKK